MKAIESTRRAVDDALTSVEEHPVVVVLAAAGATIGTAIVLGTIAGWPHVFDLVETRRSWLWLLACLGGELVAYGGYVLTLRDMARVDEGPELDLDTSVRTVVGGFGVFAATRSTGGFAVDYWAFRRGGATPREAAHRVLGLGFLEYVVLSAAALVASAALAFRLDGHAGLTVTLPGLAIVPALAAAWWATSPKRVERLKRPRRSRVKGMLANSVAGAHYVRQLLASPREHGLGVLGNVVYWAGDIGCLAAALALCGGELSWSRLVLAYSGGYVLTRRALPAGGAGLVEVALTFALVGFGVHLTRALVAVVLYRLFNFWLPIVPALYLMPALTELRRRFRAAEPARP
ncbi:MAG TPA: lysylphosphatidylglycerol synthase domain-containing protein [Gaiellaceae bacterium]